MKVMFVSHGLPPKELGGGEIYTFTLAKALLKLGIEVVVFSRTVDHKKRDYSILKENIEGLTVYRIVNNYNDIYSFFDLFINRHIATKFNELLKYEQPDIVHYQHLLGLSGDLPQVSKLLGISSVLTLHDYWYICPRVNCLTPDNKICSGPSYGYNCVACYCNNPNPQISISNSSFLGRLVLNRQIRSAARRFLPQPVKDFIKRYLFNTSPQPSNAENAAEQTSGTSPFVVLPHQISEYFFRYFFLQNQLSLCAYILAPSKYIKSKYETNGIDNIIYIPLGIELLPKKPKSVEKRGKIVIGYVGNISQTKGFSVLIRELTKLKDYDNFVVFVHGQVYDKEYFRQVMDSVPDNLRDRIKFRGRFERDIGVLKNIYHNMDVLIFPSVCEENAPLVVREALSCGVPVVGSFLGGVPEVVADGKNGFLFDPFIQGALADKLRLVLEDKDVLDRLQKGAQNTEIFGIDDHASEILNVYRQVS